MAANWFMEEFRRAKFRNQWSYIGERLARILSEEHLDQIVAGLEENSLEDIRKRTVQAYTPASRRIRVIPK